MPPSPPPPISRNAVHYQLTARQIVNQWFRLRMLQPRTILLNVLCFGLGIYFLVADRRQVLTWALLAVPILFCFFFYRKLQQLVKQHPEMSAPRWMSFDRDGVVFGSATSRNEYPWERIRRFAENQEYYYLYLNEIGTAANIPKSAFDAEQREEFLTLCCSIPAKPA